MSQPELLEMKKQVAAFLEQGIIEPSSSPYAAPVLFVKKKSEQLLAAYAADEAFASMVDMYDQDQHGLYRTRERNQIVVPNCPELKARILVEMHDAQFAGHVGITKTLERISRMFWWPRMRSESDGQTERYNRTLEEMLRHYISLAQSDWPFFLSLAEFAVNNSWQESIQSTPFLVNTGQSPLTPALLELPGEVYCPTARRLSEWWQSNVKQARHFMELAQRRQAYMANKGRKEVEYHTGQLVLLSTRNLRMKPGKAKKLLPRFIGPFKVLEHVGPVAVRLDLPQAMARMHPVFHVSLLRPYTSEHPHLPPPVEWLDVAPLYEVEKLLAHRGVRADMADGTPTGETPGAGTSADPDNFRGLLALARTDPNFRRDLEAALNPAGTSANHSRPGTGPLDDELLNDEEEVEDEEPDEDEEEEDEAEQLREELAATRMELNSLRIRQRNMDRALSSLAAQAVPGPDKWTDACAKSVRTASAFCDDLEAHCARYSLDIVSVFPAFLSGAARNAWYPSVQQAHFAQTGVAPPWQFLRASFLEYTGDDLRDDMLEARDRLLDRSIRMGPNYPELSEYLIAFRNNLLTAGAQCMDESLLVNLFVTGLSPSLRETVLKDIVPLQNPTLTQAIDFARQAQRNAVFLAGAVSSKRHVAAVQGRAITEQAEHEINDANRTLGLAGRQATTAAPRPAGRTAPRRGGMRPGPPPVATGKKAGAAAAATAVKPGQYCHHCYSPDHLKPQCPWKHLPAKQAREQSGYSRPPPGANVPQKRSRPDDDDKGQGKGKLASANAK
ncbi:hypothetical protein QJQ45_006047 [Haematococcus lacustris]|nr:hypothetical protein QJQ45_006047 [Haematococcus lacustris]